MHQLQNMSTIKQFLTVEIYLKQQTDVQQMLIALCISSVIFTPLKVVYFVCNREITNLTTYICIRILTVNYVQITWNFK